MPTDPVFYAKPTTELKRLRMAPRLASWNAAGDPDQVRLVAALDDVTELLLPDLRATQEPVALRLDVGLPPTVPLLAEHDLDNYAFPFTRHLASAASRAFASVWCTKQHAADSYAGVGRATQAVSDDRSGAHFSVRTTASASTTAYKQEIDDQLHGAVPLPDGPLSIQIAFAVGPHRNWLNLWKPTIDAMERLLGRTRPDRAWHPRDGRIVELGLHCINDPGLANDVAIVIRADCAPDL